MKPPSVVSAFLSSGGVPPGAREDIADWQKRQPPAFPTHHPKSAERSRVLLSTTQSRGLVSPTLNEAVSLLREDQDRSGTAFVIRVPRKPIPVLSSLRKPGALFSGRFRAARAWPLRLRLRRALLWSLRSADRYHNLQEHVPIKTPVAHRSPAAPLRGAASFAHHRPPTRPSARDTRPEESRAVFGVAPASRWPFPKRLAGMLRIVARRFRLNPSGETRCPIYACPWMKRRIASLSRACSRLRV